MPLATFVLFNMIQEGQLLGGWQNVLERIYKENRLLAMFLGDCDKCFSNFIGQVSFIIFLVLEYNLQWWGWWNVLVWVGMWTWNVVASVLIINLVSLVSKKAKDGV